MKEELKLLKQVYMGINLQIREIAEQSKPQAEKQIDKVLIVLEELYDYHNRLLIEFHKRKAIKPRLLEDEDRDDGQKVSQADIG